MYLFYDIYTYFMLLSCLYSETIITLMKFLWKYLLWERFHNYTYQIEITYTRNKLKKNNSKFYASGL